MVLTFRTNPSRPGPGGATNWFILFSSIFPALNFNDFARLFFPLVGRGTVKRGGVDQVEWFLVTNNKGSLLEKLSDLH